MLPALDEFFYPTALLERPVRIFGNGKQVRDILYVTDAVRAFHAFYERGKPGIYNIGGGPDYSMSLLECVEYIGKITGKEPVVEFEKERLGDLLYFVCNTAKAEKELQWRPS